MSVVFRKTLTKDENIKKGNFETVRKQDPDYQSLRKLENDEVAPPTVSYDLKMQIQKARQAKNMSQDDLAKACNKSVKTIRDYEKGEGIIEPATLNIISRVLCVKLTRPKPKKLND